MKTKLKIIIPTIIAIAAVITAAFCISFTPNTSQNIEEMLSTAQKYLYEQNYEQAILEYEPIINLDPKNVDAYLGLAQAYTGIGDTEKAVEVLEKGFEMTGDERIKAMLDELLGDEDNTEEISEVSSSEITEATEITSVVTEEISYTDEELTAALRKLVENPDADIEQSKLDSIKAICIWGNDLYYASSSENVIMGGEVFDVRGFSYYSSSFEYEVTFAEFTSLDFIKRIKNVKFIDISYSHLNDINAVSEMTEITYLWLNYNRINDISVLSNLTSLDSLCLEHAELTDLSALSNLTNLGSLNLAYNGISDISALSNLVDLKGLNLSYNQITNISPLRGLSNLTYLDISNNLSTSMYHEIIFDPYYQFEHQIDQSILNSLYINDFSPLYDMKQLNYLCLSDESDIKLLDEPYTYTYIILNDEQKSKLQTELPNCEIDYIKCYNNLLCNTGRDLILSI